MRTAEIVPAHIERNSMFQVLQFPAMGVGQTSEAAKLSAFTQATCKVVELLGAQRPDLELIIWASVARSDEDVNELAALITPEDADLLERVVRSVFWSYGLHLCDLVGGLPA